MKTFAWVVDGVAFEVFEGDELFPVHPDIAAQWVEAPSGTQVGDLFKTGVWARPAVTPSRATLWALACSEALAALEKTGVTVERVMEAVSLGTTTLGADDIQNFMQYRRDLRAFPHLDVSDESKPLPVVPAHPGYPAGT